jgi:hypothetical protein
LHANGRDRGFEGVCTAFEGMDVVEQRSTSGLPLTLFRALYALEAFSCTILYTRPEPESATVLCIPQATHYRHPRPVLPIVHPHFVERYQVCVLEDQTVIHVSGLKKDQLKKGSCVLTAIEQHRPYVHAPTATPHDHVRHSAPPPCSSDRVKANRRS